MKHTLPVVLCLLVAPCLWAQSSKDPKGFEGAWIGSFIHHNQPPRTWTYVFEDVHDNTCTGFFWTGTRHLWTRCEIKDGEITVYSGGKTPTVTGRILSPTQLELGWHAWAVQTAAEREAGAPPRPEIHTFIATKQPPEYVQTLVDPTHVAGVDRSRMGVYRALAELIVDSVKKNDLETAAKLSRILEIAWDRGETELNTKSPKIWGGIDAAMDAFVLPIIAYQKTPPDAAKIDAACRAFLDTLKRADSAKSH